MSDNRINLRLPADMIKEIDRFRGDTFMTRPEFVKSLLDRVLSNMRQIERDRDDSRIRALQSELEQLRGDYTALRKLYYRQDSE